MRRLSRYTRDVCTQVRCVHYQRKQTQIAAVFLFQRLFEPPAERDIKKGKSHGGLPVGPAGGPLLLSRSQAGSWTFIRQREGEGEREVGGGGGCRAKYN